jgi:5'-deoxynucleotidase YfbR-like HD superfamily hydrolase
MERKMEKINYLIKVDKAEYLSDYKIFLEFDDKTSKVVDLAKELTGVFERLQNVDEFKNFNVTNGILCWGDDLDIAPEYLKYEAEDISNEVRKYSA